MSCLLIGFWSCLDFGCLASPLRHDAAPVAVSLWLLARSASSGAWVVAFGVIICCVIGLCQWPHIPFHARKDYGRFRRSFFVAIQHVFRSIYSSSSF